MLTRSPPGAKTGDGNERGGSTRKSNKFSVGEAGLRERSDKGEHVDEQCGDTGTCERGSRHIQDGLTRRARRRRRGSTSRQADRSSPRNGRSEEANQRNSARHVFELTSKTPYQAFRIQGTEDTAMRTMDPQATYPQMMNCFELYWRNMPAIAHFWTAFPVSHGYRWRLPTRDSLKKATCRVAATKTTLPTILWNTFNLS